MSQDLQFAEALRRSLAIYRMVFGQPRQDDLVEYLLRRLARDEVDKIVERVRVDVGPRARRDQP